MMLLTYITQTYHLDGYLKKFGHILGPKIGGSGPKQKLVKCIPRALFRLQTLGIGQKNQHYYIRAKKHNSSIKLICTIFGLNFGPNFEILGFKKPQITKFPANSGQ